MSLFYSVIKSWLNICSKRWENNYYKIIDELDWEEEDNSLKGFKEDTCLIFFFCHNWIIGFWHILGKNETLPVMWHATSTEE